MKKLVLLLFISSIFATKGQEKQDRTGNLIGYAQKSDFLKKNIKDGLNISTKIIRVPNFIFYKDEEEIGRYVEYPRESMEKDILKY